MAQSRSATPVTSGRKVAGEHARRTSHYGAHAEGPHAILSYHSAGRTRNMTKFVVIALSALTLMQSAALSVAGDKSTDTRAKPSSFVPHPHTNSHVYAA